jgi:hypothetical protein
MKPEAAIEELRKLKQQTSEDPQVQAATPQHKEWKAKVVAVLERTLGADSSTVQQFKELRYDIGIWSGAPGEAEQDARYFRERVQDAAALIGAAIYELELSAGAPAVEGGSYDSGLWDHVKHSVEEERWEQVASAAAIYVEDKVRRWAGNPLNKDGGRLVGQALFVKALSAGGPLALGAQANETEGWRNLGNRDGRRNQQRRPTRHSGQTGREAVRARCAGPRQFAAHADPPRAPGPHKSRITCSAPDVRSTWARFGAGWWG